MRAVGTKATDIPMSPPAFFPSAARAAFIIPAGQEGQPGSGSKGGDSCFWQTEVVLEGASVRGDPAARQLWDHWGLRLQWRTGGRSAGAPLRGNDYDVRIQGRDSEAWLSQIQASVSHFVQTL